MLLLVTLLTLLTLVAANEPDTCLTLSFDDTFQSGKTMSSYLDQYNWKATFYVSPARLGCLHPDYLTWWDINDLYQQGHEIGCHGFSHEKSFDLDYNGLRNQFCMCRAMLRRFGPPTSIAYPHAQVNNTIKGVAKECGFCNGRGVGPTLEVVKPRDIWDFKSYSIRREDKCNKLYSILEDGIRSTPTYGVGKLKWIVLNNHVLCEDNDSKCTDRYPFSISRSTFECFIGHVKRFYDQKLLCVKNVKEMLHLEPNQTSTVPRSFNSIDLPSDFQFDPALNPNNIADSGGYVLQTSILSFGVILALL